MVDVRSPGEYRGELLHMPTPQRARSGEGNPRGATCMARAVMERDLQGLMR